MIRYDYMNKYLLGVIAVIVVIAVAVLFYRPRPHSSVSAPTPAGNTVLISNFSFNPATLTIKAGDSVTFTNNDSVGHSVVADDGSFDTGILAQGQSKTLVFSKAGTFAYHCSVHPSMKAAIVVQ